MYRRSRSSQQQVRAAFLHGATPLMQNAAARRTTNLLQPITGSGLRRSISANNLPRPSTVTRSRPSSVGRSGAKSVGRPSLGGALLEGKKMAKDPRPVKEHAFMQKQAEKILDFMRRNDYTGPQITVDQLRFAGKLSRDDFAALFKFLYSFVDEKFQYDEIKDKKKPADAAMEKLPQVLEQLGYPLTLKPSTMKTWNIESSWPHVLAALAWLREFVEYGIKWDYEQTMFPSVLDNFWAGVNRGKELSFELVAYNCYCHWFNEKKADIVKDPIDEFVYSFLCNAIDVESRTAYLEQLSQENERLKEEFAMLEAKLAQPDELKKQMENQHHDMAQMDLYIKTAEDFCRSIQPKIDDLDQKQMLADKELEELEAEINQNKGLIAKQSLKAADYQHLIGKKAEVAKRVAALQSEKEELQKARYAQEMRVAQKADTLKQLATEFNKKVKAFMRSMPDLRESMGDLEISPFHPKFLDNAKNDIMPWIKGIQEHLSNNVKNTEGILMDYQNKLAAMKTESDNIDAECKRLDSMVKQSDAEMLEYQEKMDLEHNRLREEMESLRRQIENVTRQKGMSKSAKNKMLAALKKELADKKQFHEKEKAAAMQDFMDAVQEVSKSVKKWGNTKEKINGMLGELLEQLQKSNDGDGASGK